MNLSGHDYIIISQLSQSLKYSTVSCLHANTDLEHVQLSMCATVPHQHNNVDHVRIVRIYFFVILTLNSL